LLARRRIDFCLVPGGGIIELNIKIKIPPFLERIYVRLLLLRYRRLGPDIRLIPLTKARFAIVDLADYERLRKHKWRAARSNRTFYAVRTDPESTPGRLKLIWMHREVLQAKLASSPHPLRGPGAQQRGPSVVADHINHNGLDNRRANLRLATVADNNYHRRKRISKTRSRYKGVDLVKPTGKFRARIRAEGRRRYLGAFESETDAARTYDKAAKKHHKEFAVLNFPVLPTR